MKPCFKKFWKSCLCTSFAVSFFFAALVGCRKSKVEKEESSDVRGYFSLRVMTERKGDLPISVAIGDKTIIFASICENEYENISPSGEGGLLNSISLYAEIEVKEPDCTKDFHVSIRNGPTFSIPLKAVIESKVELIDLVVADGEDRPSWTGLIKSRGAYKFFDTIPGVEINK